MFLKRDLNSWLAKNMSVSFVPFFSVSDIKDHNFFRSDNFDFSIRLMLVEMNLVLDRYFLYEVDTFKIFRLP